LIGFAADFHTGMIRQDMLLWNAEVQYVCRDAARQSYGQQIRGLAGTHGFRWPSGTPKTAKRLNISSWTGIL
jgi:hypothetical protein